MTFKEKIDKILRYNELKINSVSALEDYLKAGRGSINDFYKENREPGRKTLKRILSLPGLNKTWWETGTGEVFCKSFEEKPTHEHKTTALMEKSDNDEKSMMQIIDDVIGMLKENNNFLREQNDKLRASLDEAHKDYVKLTTITLSHGQK